MNKLTHNEIISRLCQAGFPTFLVGGLVRDTFAGLEPHDIDITTKATPEQISAVFPDNVVQEQVGKSFGVTLVDGFDVATFRLDRFPNGNGAKNCKPSFADTIDEDLSRRDLTINALALCALSGELIDNHNGIQDLKNGIIRFVGDPDLRIAEDPDRIVRACRFVAKIKGSFSPDTVDALRRNVHLLSSVEPDRIGKEVLSAMKVDTPSLFFSALALIGALPFVFPGMEDCLGHAHGVHHKEDVWEHLMLAGDKVSPKFPLVRLAAFLHDVGKPSAFVHAEGVNFSTHDDFGADMVHVWLANLVFPHATRDLVVGLIKSHMWVMTPDVSNKAIRKLRFRLNELGVSVQEWLRLRIADTHANLTYNDLSFTDIKKFAVRIGVGPAQVEDVPFSVNELALKGGVLIKLFNLKPGPIVSALQKHLLSFVIENGEDFNNSDTLQDEAVDFLDKNNL